MYKANELYKPKPEDSSGWIFLPNGRRLYPAVGTWAKEYCARHVGYFYRDSRAIIAERAANDVGLLLRKAEDFTLAEAPQDVIQMLDELRHERITVDEYTTPEGNTNRARYIDTDAAQPDWFIAKRSERQRERAYTNLLRATDTDTHYFNCKELLKQGIYECKHFTCKCPCHQRLNDTRAQCWWRSQNNEAHGDCPCVCHI